MNISESQSELYKSYLSYSGVDFKREKAKILLSKQPFCLDLIKQYFPQDKTAQIFDLGCGAGFLLHYARQQGYQNIQGIDYSHEQVELAQQLNIDGIEQGNIFEKLPNLPAQSQDMVISIDLVEHLSKEQVVSLGKAVHRILKPGGSWLIQTVNGQSPFFGNIRFGDFTHVQAFNTNSMKQLLSLSGFHQSRSYEISPIAHGYTSHIRKLLWRFFVRKLYLLLFMIETGERQGIFSQNFITLVTKG